MAKTITGNLSYRKQYALQCLLKGIHSRGFDNCFEMGDGDEVVRFIMKKATEKLRTDFIDIHGNINYKRMKKLHKQEKLVKALKDRGAWDGWYKFYMEGK